jgi:hypothetical protein
VHGVSGTIHTLFRRSKERHVSARRDEYLLDGSRSGFGELEHGLGVHQSRGLVCDYQELGVSKHFKKIRVAKLERGKARLRVRLTTVVAVQLTEFLAIERTLGSAPYRMLENFELKPHVESCYRNSSISISRSQST